MSQNFDNFKHLVRISGTDIRGDKHVINGLTMIRGIGPRMADLVLKKADIPPGTYIGLLNDNQIKRLDEIIKAPVKNGIPSWFVNHRKERESGEDIHITSSTLALYERNDIDRLKKLRSYRGIKHAVGHKVRGQRTKSTGRGGRSLGFSRAKK